MVDNAFSSYGWRNFLRYRVDAGLTGVALGGAAKLTSGGFASGSVGSGAAIGGSMAAAGEGLRQVTESMKNWSMVLIFLGLIQYFLRYVLGDSSSIIILLSFVMFAMAGYALSEKVQVDKAAIILPMFFFCLWYFYFKASVVPSFLIYFVGTCAAVLLAVDVFTKGRAIQPELYGIIPVLFLFLDIGLIPFLVDTLGLEITSLTTNMILFMPWWTFFGLMTLPIDSIKNPSINFFMRAIHTLGIIYIVLVFLIPAIPTVGYESDSFFPSISELAESQEEAREELSGIEPYWLSQIKCFGILFSGDADFAGCVEDRQLESGWSATCAEDSEVGSNEHNICVDDKRTAYEDGTTVGGSTESELDQYVELSVSLSGSFNEQITNAYSGELDKQDFPIDIEISNPKNKQFALSLSCSFESRDESTSGVVIRGGKEISESISIEEEFARTYYCQPTTDLNGSYELQFNTTVEDFTTVTYLKRAFVNEYDEDNSLLIERINSYVDNTGPYSADEFARINFIIGEPADNHIIALDNIPTVNIELENIGDGKIVSVNSYSLELDDFEIDDYDCLAGGVDSVFLPDDQRDSIFIGSCDALLGSELTSIMGDLTSVEYWPELYLAYLDYDYQLSLTQDVEVTLRE